MGNSSYDRYLQHKIANQEAIAKELENTNDAQLQREAERQRQEIKGLKDSGGGRCPRCGGTH